MSVNHVTCTLCGSILGGASSACRGCGATASSGRHPLFGAVARNPDYEPDGAKDLTITAHDFILLEELARLRLNPECPAAHGLLEKLELCRVVKPDMVEPDVVTLNSRVVFSVDGNAAEERVLVLPDGHTLQGWSLPVTAPRGLGMLGLRAGTTFVVERYTGMTERIEILSVAYQPEENARQRDAVATTSIMPAPLALLRRPAVLKGIVEPSCDGDHLPSAANDI